ncbi:putative MFS multidrug transporter [Sporormia fimetaria CBS 119925]|uniref:Putative MFS multidrug transporter n=1 Tax=Sporormia fimetaria CBS 119925 TaxID=1340428 RepID=A0A6A6UWF7_9PLEO|nr:putative MFS multidrug transporter [Sporormia fimetaria CBS 119925]
MTDRPHSTTEDTTSGIRTPSPTIYPADQQRQRIASDDSEDFDQYAEKCTTSDEDEEPEEQEIQHRYLTFDTDVPLPISVTTARPHHNVEPPPQPDLSKYTSPFDWSPKRKNMIIWISCVITCLTAFTAGAYSPGVPQMTQEWGISNVAALVGITMFTSGFAIAPMVLAPFSEIRGRRPVFIISGLLFVLCQLCTGLTQSYAGMLVVRFIAGVGGSTFSTMVGGVISDIYHTADRNTPMALFSGAALFGTGFGPLISGFIAQNLNWRWIFYIQTIVDGIMVAVIILTFQETRGSVLLSRKAAALNTYYDSLESAGYSSALLFPSPTTTSSSFSSTTTSPPTPLPQRIRWLCKSDTSLTSLSKMISLSLYRPFHLLFTEPVVFFFSLWVSFSWAVLYLTLAAIPLVYQRAHNFSLQTSNAVFGALCLGAAFATVLSIYQESYLTVLTRLYFSCIESLCLPLGLFLFGWTSADDIHWIVPALGISIATVGIFSIYLSVFNYLADTYHRYASSALASQSFCRNILGGAFPLITTQMYNKLGFGEASSLLGGIGLLLTLVPWVLVFYGPKIRARSKFASEIMSGNVD